MESKPEAVYSGSLLGVVDFTQHLTAVNVISFVSPVLDDVPQPRQLLCLRQLPCAEDFSPAQSYLKFNASPCGLYDRELIIRRELE